MRFIFLTGGFVGLLAVAIMGLSAGRAVDLVLRDAAIGALVGGILFRWFWSIFVKLLSQAVRAKRAAEAASEAANNAAAATAKAPAGGKAK